MQQWQAKWIWTTSSTSGKPGATTRVARRVFDARRDAEACTLAISANSSYHAYLNGTFIGRGPDRADPRYPYFDSYDVSHLIKAGRNVLVILARHIRPVPGSRAWCLSGGEPGLLVELVGPDLHVASDAGWRMIPAPGHLDDMETISRFLGPKAHVNLEDSRRIDAMHDAAFDDRDWPHAVEQGDVLPTPLPREIPMLVRREHPPRLAGTINPIATAIDDTSPLLGYVTANPVVVHPHPQGAWITLDFGRTMGGFPRLKFQAQGGTVDVYYGEGTRWLMADRLELPRDGVAEYEPLDWRGGRHVALHFRDLSAPVKVLAATFVEMVYPFKADGDFNCDDQTLTSVFRTSRLTAHVGIKDHPVDCCWREQALWLSDMIIHNRTVLACFGDPRPMDKAIRQALRVMHDDGVIPVPGPVGLGYLRTEKLLPWSGQAVTLPITMRDLYWFTGDAALAQWAMPRLKLLFKHFAKYEDETGLLQIDPPGLPELIDFPGWNPTLHKGRPSGLTFRYICSLRCAAELAAAAGDADTASLWRKRADQIGAAAHRTFWDAERNLYSDGIKDGVRLTSYSPSQNAWGVLAGILPALQVGAWAEALRHDPPILPPWSPYDAAAVLDALLAHGLDLHARALLDEYYGSIIRAGEPTLPEFWKHNDPSGWRYHRRDESRCHPYGSSPAYQCLHTILGVRGVEPGWRRIAVQPRPMGLHRAAGRVATPHAPIHVAWERHDTMWTLDLDLPTSHPVDIVLPGIGTGHRRLWLDEQLVWSDMGWPGTEARIHLQSDLASSRNVKWTLAAAGRHSLRLEGF